MHSGLAIKAIAHPLAGCTTDGSRGLNCRMCGSLNVRLMPLTSSEGHSFSSHKSLFPRVALTAGGTFWTIPLCRNKSRLCRASPIFSSSSLLLGAKLQAEALFFCAGLEGTHVRIVVSRLQTLWVSFGTHVLLKSILAPRSVHGSLATKRAIDASVSCWQPCRLIWMTPRFCMCCNWLDNASTLTSEISQSPKSIFNKVTLQGNAATMACTPASLRPQERNERKIFFKELISSVSANNNMLLSPIFSTPETSKSKSLGMFDMRNAT